MPETPQAEVHTEIEALPHQEEFWGNTEQDARVAMVGPLGCGKSYGLAVKCLLLSLVNKPLDGMLIVPTYTLFRMVHMVEWPAIMEGLGIELRWHGTDHAFIWPWGARTWVRSAEHPQRLAGPNLAYVLYDEPGQIKREAWERGVTRARHPKATLRQVVAGGTPEGINYFADLFATPEGQYRTIWADQWHPDMAHYYSQIEETYGYDDSLLAAYGKGQFVPMRTGRVYSSFVRSIHVKPVEYQQGLPLVVCCDFNVGRMRWELAQLPRGGWNYIDEISLGTNSDTAAACREVIRRYEAHRGDVIVVGDASGQARSTSGPTDYQIIREEFKAVPGWNLILRVPSSNPRQKFRADCANYHMSGRGLLTQISPSCKELVLDFERVAWRPGSSEIDKSDDDRTHASDAGTMGMWVLARPKTLDRGHVSTHRDKVRSPDPVLDMEF